MHWLFDCIMIATVWWKWANILQSFQFEALFVDNCEGHRGLSEFYLLECSIHIRMIQFLIHPSMISGRNEMSVKVKFSDFLVLFLYSTLHVISFTILKCIRIIIYLELTNLKIFWVCPMSVIHHGINVHLHLMITCLAEPQFRSRISDPSLLRY